MQPLQKHNGITEQRRAQNRAAQRNFRNKKREREKTRLGSSPELALLDPSSSSSNQEQETLVDSGLAQRVLSTSNELEPGSVLGTSITPIDWSIETQKMQLQDHWMNLDDLCSDNPSYHSLGDFESNQEFDAAKVSRSVTQIDFPAREAGSHLGKTALHLAAEHGHTQCAQVLLRVSSADVNATDAEGNTALHLSAYCGHLAIAQLLILNNAAMDMPNDLGYSPLHCAVERNSLAIVRLMIEHGVEINKRVEIPVL